MLELIPLHTDYELQCGKRLELKILPKTGNPKGPVELTITAENVDMECGLFRLDEQDSEQGDAVDQGTPALGATRALRALGALGALSALGHRGNKL